MMIRQEGPDDYQIGIWAVRREHGKWRAVATGPGTIGDGSPQEFETLTAAYEALTGEPISFDDRSKLYREWRDTTLVGKAFMRFENACATFWQADGNEHASPSRVKKLDEALGAARAELLKLIRGW